MIFSIGIGFLMCFGIISIFTGKNYFKVTRDLDKVIDTYYAIVDNYYGDLDKSTIIPSTAPSTKAFLSRFP